MGCSWLGYVVRFFFLARGCSFVEWWWCLWIKEVAFVGSFVCLGGHMMLLRFNFG